VIAVRNKPANQELLKTVFEAASNKQAHDIVLLDVRRLTYLADYLLICHGHARAHVHAIAEEIRVKLKKFGLGSGRMERDKEESWVLLDFNEIICHVLSKEARDYYSLEKFWDDAQRIVDKR
jgi:ribosome-associated protein